MGLGICYLASLRASRLLAGQEPSFNVGYNINILTICSAAGVERIVFLNEFFFPASHRGQVFEKIPGASFFSFMSENEDEKDCF